MSTVFTLFIGYIVDRFSYFPAFVVAGTVPLLATVIVLLLIRAPENVREPGSEGDHSGKGLG
jgi:MFS transporter, ACS family, aldohexuronate transporter